MRTTLVSKLLAVFLLCLGPALFAKESTDEAKGPEGTKAEIKEYIQHHLQDSHDFSIASYTNQAG